MVRLHQVAEPLPYVWGAVFPLSVVTRRPYARRELCRVEPGLSVRMGFGACYHETSESGIQKQLAKQVQGEPPGLDRIVRGLTRAPYQSIWKEVVPVRYPTFLFQYQCREPECQRRDVSYKREHDQHWDIKN